MSNFFENSIKTCQDSRYFGFAADIRLVSCSLTPATTLLCAVSRFGVFASAWSAESALPSSEAWRDIITSSARAFASGVAEAKAGRSWLASIVANWVAGGGCSGLQPAAVRRVARISACFHIQSVARRTDAPTMIG